MQLLKGIRFGLPLVVRIGNINLKTTHRIAWNRHDGFEVHYVIKGDFIREVEAGKRHLKAKGGTFLIIPPNLRHRAPNDCGVPSESIGVIYSPLSPSITHGTSFTDRDLERIFAKYDSTSPAVHTTPPPLQRLLVEMRNAIDSFSTNNPDSILHLRMLNERLLWETYRALDNCLGTRSNSVIKTIQKIIDANPAEATDIERLVRRSGYSRSRFFSLFFSEIGKTPKDYILRSQLNFAKGMLKDTDLTVVQIASKCGFNSPEVFVRNFKKFNGCSPLAWRKRAI